MVPCPHCRATAAIERSALLRWRCAVCGGPVVPSDGSFPRASGEIGDLVRAARTSAMSLGWAAAAVVLAGGGFVMALLGLLLWRAAHLPAMVLGVVAGASLALSFASTLRSRARRADSRAALDRAWTAVAGELLAARGKDVTASDLARALSTDEAAAEEILSALSAEGRVRVDVRDDAQLSYRSSPDAAGEADTQSPADGARRRP
jgi:hypothetical protein